MKNMHKVPLAITKVLEILHWALTVWMAVMLVGSATAGSWFTGMMETFLYEGGTELSTYGFEVLVADSAGNINLTLILLFSIGGVLIASLIAMCFRNTYLILKKSQNTTPFQKDNIRMLREIGIFQIAIPVIGVILCTIMRAIVGVDAVEASMSMSGLVIGILMLCLTQFFAHGVELETDMAGLL